MQSSHSLDRLSVAFCDRHAVANAGLILPATLAEKLGLRELIDRHVRLGSAPGAAHAGVKAMTLIYSALAGGDCIDDAALLRSGSTAALLAHELRAPSTLGTYLRSFTFGHTRQLDAVSRQLFARAWGAGAGVGDAPLTIDIDSTICETYGLAKEGGSRFTYTGVRGYHPLLAVVAGTGEVLHSRLRAGPANTIRGSAHFIGETITRLRGAGASGKLTLRADSGFYSAKVVAVCRKRKVCFSITMPIHRRLHARLGALPEEAWTAIPYFLPGAGVAEISYTPFGAKGTPVRLIVRRVPPTPGSQLALFTHYTYHAFICNREGDTLTLEADHRRHAEIENIVRDLKYGVGLNHLPSGKFAANAAWLAFQVLAHNLGVWVNRLGLRGAPLRTKTLRSRYLALAGRLTRSARRLFLALPACWPWQDEFMAALTRLRSLPLLA
jgi:hypothetical protein